MNRKQMACYALLASALTLGGLLAVQLNNRVSRADAAMVLARDSITMMTARSSNDDEALLVLDNASERLLVYGVALRGQRGELSLKQVVDLRPLFASGAGAGGAGSTGRGGR